MSTVFSIVAQNGLLYNQGFVVSTDLATAVNTYNQLDIASAAQATLSSPGGSNSAVQLAVRAIPEFLTGVASQQRRSGLANLILTSTNFDNTISSVLDQATAIYGTGPSTLINVLTRVKSFVETSYALYENHSKLANVDIAQYGITVSNYQDLITGGVTSQFSYVGSAAYIEFANQLGNFGTMFDISQLSSITRAHVLCIHLLNQGFTVVGDALIDYGIDVNALSEIDNKIVLAALATITGKTLENIFAITKFKPYRTCSTLADVFNGANLFSPRALHVAGGTLSSLENKFLNLGGTFETFEQLKQFFLNIDASVAVDQFSDAVVNNISLDTTKLGVGTGVYGNPRVVDILGSLIGHNYIDSINTMINAQQTIQSHLLGQNLKNALLAAQTIDPTDPTGQNAAAAITLATTNLISTTDANITNAINLGSNAFVAMFDQLVREKTNYNLVNIEEDDLDFSLDSLRSFVLSLATISDDTYNLGYARFIKDLTDTSIYGQSIRASITEGYNRSIITRQSINTFTQL